MFFPGLPKITGIGAGSLKLHHDYVRSIWESYAKNKPTITNPKGVRLKITPEIVFILPIGNL